MDEPEFRRRIEVYLDLDLPAVSERDQIAEALSTRLWPYVDRPVRHGEAGTKTLGRLLPKDRPSVLVFVAGWDTGSMGFVELVSATAAPFGANVVELDLDDTVGGAIAVACGVMNVPTVVMWHGDEPVTIVGRRTAEELQAAFTTSFGR